MKAIACPDPARYQQLAAGGLPGEEKEALLRHLEGCDACAARVASLPEPETVLGLVRQGRTPADGPSAERVAALVEQMRGLKPGETATGGAEEQTLPPRDPQAPRTLTVVCPGCGKKLKVKEALAGKKVKCPACQHPVLVSAAPSGAAAQPTPSPAAACPAQATLPPADAPGAAEPTTAGGPDGPQQTQDAVPTEDHGPDAEAYDFLAPPQAPDELGRLGPYRVLEVLGAGGMGVVFRAEDPQLKRPVALKAMLPGLAASGSAKKRFLREAQSAAAIKHDHIVSIYQVGEDRGAPYLAMEFLEGEPLDQRLRHEGRLPLKEVLRVGREMAEGLEAAHERGLIHRDIKPANVWLEGKKGRVKILDFGLARAAAEESHITQSGVIVGTPAYMAPEQAQGKTVDHRCDLFSLGCVLYRLCSGEQPFKGTDTISTLMAVATENPRPPRELNADVPQELSDLVMRLLAKKPEDRPQSAREVAEALEGMQERLKPTAAATSPTAKVASPGGRPAKSKPAADGAGRTPPRRRRLLAAAAAGALALLAAGVVFFLQSRAGTVRVEIDDPDITATLDKDGATLRGPVAETRLDPGEHGLRIRRGEMEFETTRFLLRKGDKVTLRIELLPGKLQVVQDGSKVIDQKDLRGAPIDLLALIDPRRDAVAGTWGFDKEKCLILTSNAGPYYRIQIPYVPPEEYDLSLVAEMISPNSQALVLGLVGGGKHFQAVLDYHQQSGLQWVDGKDAIANESRINGPIFTRDRPVAIEARVRRSSVTVLCDGKPIIDWQKGFDRLSSKPEWKLRDPQALGLGYYSTLYRVRKLVLVPVGDDKGKALPGGSSSQPPEVVGETFTDARGKSLPYRLFPPEPVEPGKKYPLVVFLHSAPQGGTDNEKQVTQVKASFLRPETQKQYPCFVLTPQRPADQKWCDVDWYAPTHRQPAQPSEPSRLTLELIARLLHELPIDPKRVYLTGESDGGYGTWDLAARRPDLFAAVVPLCGGADETTAPRLSKTPVWVFHGEKDTTVKPARSRNMVEALKKAGGNPRYTELPGAGHFIASQVYNDAEFLKWLFGQRLASPAQRQSMTP